MLGVAGQHPFLPDPPDTRFRPAHLAAQSCGGAYLLKLRSRFARNRTRNHSFLRSRKVVMVIVMMEVMGFLPRAPWHAFRLWSGFRLRFRLRLWIEERIRTERNRARTMGCFRL